ncbi:DUF3784 domain-containing protein [Cyclobacterium xiamenense]|uniref:DUF3784 domain-containing protein n=1 Tax=Cyclobacterium xiamenense TaxID=1297121 RepID=UPI0035CFC5EF
MRDTFLSGYNTMSEEDRKKVDIQAYVPYFRNFHLFLGISFLIGGIALYFFVSENAGGVFLAFYPIIAYIYFTATSSRFSKGQSKKWNKVAVGILGASLLLVMGLLAAGFKENKLVVDSTSVSFNGSYGEKLGIEEIQTVRLVNQLPPIALKKNGFALGTINKGYFGTKDGETVKLILNSDNKPIILVTKTNGKKIYYSAKDQSNVEIVEEMKQKLPTLSYEK